MQALNLVSLGPELSRPAHELSENTPGPNVPLVAGVMGQGHRWDKVPAD